MKMKLGKEYIFEVFYLIRRGFEVGLNFKDLD